MNAEFFALAFFAALNPKLLAIDLLLIENRRPRMMFLCVLLGGLTVGLAIGLLDRAGLPHRRRISSQKTVSAGVDLGLEPAPARRPWPLWWPPAVPAAQPSRKSPGPGRNRATGKAGKGEEGRRLGTVAG